MLTIQRYNKPIYFTSLWKYEEENRRQAKALEEEQRKAEAARKAAEEAARKAAEEAARKAAEEAARQKRVGKILEQAIAEYRTYPKIDNELSKKAAAFMTRFTLTIQNHSEHDIKEFFGDEETAQELRKKLSPECQKTSLEFRESVQKLDEAKDPVMMLIAADNMKKFAPKKGLLSEEQQKNLVEGMKETAIYAIRNGDMSQFDEDDKREIEEMVQMIQNSDTVDFGISSKLQALIDKLNDRNNKRPPVASFIPPVPVLEIKLEEPEQEEVMQQHMQQQRSKF